MASASRAAAKALLVVAVAVLAMGLLPCSIPRSLDARLQSCRRFQEESTVERAKCLCSIVQHQQTRRCLPENTFSASVSDTFLVVRFSYGFLGGGRRSVCLRRRLSLVGDRSNRDCVLAKEVHLDLCLHFSRTARNLIGAVVPLADCSHCGFRQHGVATQNGHFFDRPICGN